MKRVLVTGGAGGIGAAICRAFAQDGCQIAVHYHHSETRAQALCAELEERYRVTARAYGADIADSKAVGAMFDQIERDGGGLDVLVCNAGIAQQKLFTDITDEDWRRMTAVDLDGVDGMTVSISAAVNSYLKYAKLLEFQRDPEILKNEDFSEVW